MNMITSLRYSELQSLRHFAKSALVDNSEDEHRHSFYMLACDKDITTHCLLCSNFPKRMGIDKSRNAYALI
jgi:hypothetical protein